MIDWDGIEQDPILGQIEIWEDQEYRGKAKAMEFRYVSVQKQKAKVLRTFAILMRRVFTLAIGGNVRFTEITIPRNFEFCLWEVNLAQQTPRELEFYIKERAGPEIYDEIFSEEGFFKRGAPLVRASRDYDWIAQFFILNRDTVEAKNVGGYCVISLEEQP